MTEQNLDPSFLAASEEAHDGLPSSLPLTDGTIGPGCEVGDCKCAFRKLTCFVLRGAGDPPRGAALCLPHNLVPEDFGGPTDVCSTRGIYTLCLSGTRPVGPQISVQNTPVISTSRACSLTHTSLCKQFLKNCCVSNG